MVMLCKKRTETRDKVSKESWSINPSKDAWCVVWWKTPKQSIVLPKTEIPVDPARCLLNRQERMQYTEWSLSHARLCLPSKRLVMLIFYILNKLTRIPVIYAIRTRNLFVAAVVWAEGEESADDDGLSVWPPPFWTRVPVSEDTVSLWL